MIRLLLLVVLAAGAGFAGDCCEVEVSTEKRSSNLNPISKKVFASVYVKVRNTSPEPVEVDPYTFQLLDQEGRVLPAIPPALAAQRIVGKVERSALAGLVGRDPDLFRQTNDKFTLDFEKYAVPPGMVPAGAFVDGMVYFEPGREKLKAATVVLPGFGEFSVEW